MAATKLVMLRRNWPGGRFARTITVGKETLQLQFNAGEPLEVNEVVFEALQFDLGKALQEVVQTRPEKFVPVVDEPPVDETEPSHELVETAGTRDEGLGERDEETPEPADAEPDASEADEATEATDAGGKKSRKRR